LSPEFFRLFLTNDKNKLINDIKKLVELSENVIHITSWEYLHNPNNWMAICGTTFSINIAFEACVSMDMLKGQSNREAIEYLRQSKNEISDAEIQRFRNYYLIAMEYFTNVNEENLRMEFTISIYKTVRLLKGTFSLEYIILQTEKSTRVVKRDCSSVRILQLKRSMAPRS